MLNLKKYKKYLYVALVVVGMFWLGTKCSGVPEKIVDTVTQIDTLLVDGPTIFRNKIVYRTVEPDTLWVTEYVESPATIAIVSANIVNDSLQIEYMINDTLHSVTMGIKIPVYGDVHVTVDPDSIPVVQTQRFGFHPEIIGGATTEGFHVGLDLWYWNDPPLLTALHYPCLTLAYNPFEDDSKVIPQVGVSGDISRKTPLRLSVYGIWDEGLGFAGGLEIPLWTLKE